MRLHPNSTTIPCYFSFDTKLDSFSLYFTPYGARGGVKSTIQIDHLM